MCAQLYGRLATRRQTEDSTGEDSSEGEGSTLPAVNYTACSTACLDKTCAFYYGSFTCDQSLNLKCSCSECCTDIPGAQLPVPSPSPPLQPSPLPPPSPPPAVNYTACSAICSATGQTCADHYGHFTCDLTLNTLKCSCSECCTDIDGAQLPPLQPPPPSPKPPSQSP